MAYTIDPFVKETFPKWAVAIESEIDESCSYTNVKDVRTEKHVSKDRIDPFGLVAVFNELSEDEKVMLAVIPEPREDKVSHGWGFAQSSTRYDFSKLYPAERCGIYRLTYVTSKLITDDMGEQEYYENIQYVIDNIIGVVINKTTTCYYGFTKRFMFWLRDTTVPLVEQHRRRDFAKRIISEP